MTGPPAAPAPLGEESPEDLLPLLWESTEAVGAAMERLDQGGFLEHCEILSAVLQAIPNDIHGLMDSDRQAWAALEEEGRNQDELLDSLFAIWESLHELDAYHVWTFLEELKEHVEELEKVEEEERWEAAQLTARSIRLCLREAGPSQLLSRLFTLDELLLEARPRGGFKVLATHPAVEAELGPDNALFCLALLEETIQLATWPVNLEALVDLERILGKLNDSPTLRRLS